jgi:hypothetical protein
MTWWRRRFGHGHSPADKARQAWRTAWEAALGQPEPGIVEALKTDLAALGLPDEDIELELEMLDGLAALAAERARLESAGLPTVETGHRVIGAEACHFSATACMPDEPSQPSGRLLFTPTRAVFVGGGAPSTIPWHTVVEVHQTARDVVLIRAGERVFRFSTNSFADALRGALLARHLMPRRQAPASP